MLGDGTQDRRRLDHRHARSRARRSSTAEASVVAGGDAADAEHLRSRHPRPGEGHRQDRGLLPRRLRPRRQERRGRAGRRRGHDPGQPDAQQPRRRLPRGADDPHLRHRRCRARRLPGTATAARRRCSRWATRPAPTTPLPQVAGFSSRGPALANDGDLLKPDITAPGQSVLAAVAPPSNQGRRFDLYSGTSMSAPHITGLAAFMLGENPTWTPMEIKSAMMTSASQDEERRTATQHRRVRHRRRPGRTRRSSSTRACSSPPPRATGAASSPARASTPACRPVEASELNIPSFADGAVAGATTLTRTFRASRAGTWTPKLLPAGLHGHRVGPGGRRQAGQRPDRGHASPSPAPRPRSTPTPRAPSPWPGPTEVRMPVAMTPGARSPSRPTVTGDGRHRLGRRPGHRRRHRQRSTSRRPASRRGPGQLRGRHRGRRLLLRLLRAPVPARPRRRSSTSTPPTTRPTST